MGKSIKVNYFLNMSYQVLVLLVAIVTTPYIARTLGAEGIGIYSYTYSVVSCFVLAAVMGTTSYAQRTIAYYQNDVVERSRKFFDVFSRIQRLQNGVLTYLKHFTSVNPYALLRRLPKNMPH